MHKHCRYVVPWKLVPWKLMPWKFVPALVPYRRHACDYPALKLQKLFSNVFLKTSSFQTPF
jgi:hypothetical protein